MAGQNADMERAMLDQDLDAAVTAGVISRAQADALIAFQRTRREAMHEAPPAPALEADEEKFRILGGFNDILVTIGLLLLIAALFSVSAVGANGIAIAFLAAVMAWGLAEVFTRRLRLALPSIILAVMFVSAVAGLTLIGVTGSLDDPPAPTVALIAGMAALAAGLHYARFRLPIDVALATCGLVATVIALLLVAWPALARHMIFAITLLAGLGVFALAMRFDLADPLRRSRKADTAFWLHLVAAPLIVHSAVAGLFGGESLRGSVLFALFADDAGSLIHLEGAQLALAILAIVIVLFVVALVIDRRALLVAGLTYAGYSLWVLFEGLAGRDGITLSATLFALALAVLGVSAGWSGLRAAIVPLFPLGRWRASLPPLRQRPVLEVSP